MVENFSGFFENFTLQDSLHNATFPFLYSVLILDPLIGFPLIGQIVSLSSSASETDNTVKNEIVYDSMGNEIKVEKKVELSDKEKKKEIKSIQKQIAQRKKKGILTDDEIAELEDKLLELKSEE